MSNTIGHHIRARLRFWLTWCATAGLAVPALAFLFLCPEPVQALTAGEVNTSVVRPVEPTRPTPLVRPDEKLFEVPLVRPGQTPAGAEQMLVQVKEIIVEGNTVLSSEELAKMTVGHIGREVALSELFALAETLTAYYRGRGYLLSQVILPPQRIGADGVATLRAVEGYVAAVVIEGPSELKALLTPYAAPITNERPLKGQTLERALLLMNDLPGVRVKATFGADESAPGASRLLLNVERSPVEGATSYNNNGSRYLGRERWSAQATLDGPVGLLDQFTFRRDMALNSPEFFQNTYMYKIFLGADGLQLSLSANDSKTRPTGPSGLLEVRGWTSGGNISLAYPVLRSRVENLRLSLGFDVLESRVDTLGVKLSQDKLRVFSVQGVYDLLDRFGGISMLTLGVRHGVLAFGAYDAVEYRSRFGANPEFTTLQYSLMRNQAIPGIAGMTAYAEIKGQYAFNQLGSAEEFSVGGSTFGRGYSPSEITGDKGIAGKLELRYDVRPQSWKDSGLQLFGFLDGGAAREGNRGNGQNGWDKDLASGGGGFRLDVTRYFNCELTVAKPLTRVVKDYDNRDPYILFSATAKF